jgi:cell division inhibitor SulA
MTQLSIFDQSTPEPLRIVLWSIGKNTSGPVDYLPLLLPTLAWQTHHNEQRWITWIASQFIEKSVLESYGVNLSSLRMIVDSQSDYSSFRLLLTALKNDRSTMVIASLPSLPESQLHQLEQAARQGNCQAIILLH